MKSFCSRHFGVALALLIFTSLCMCHPARADTNLPMTCQTPADVGKPVNVGCTGIAQTGQIYRTPLDTDLVRVRDDGATVADWSSTHYVWKAWKNVQPGELYDVCKDDVPQGQSVPNGSCTNWGMIQRLVLNIPANSAFVSWTPATMNDDGSPYTDPKGYFIYSGQSNPPLTKSALIAPAAVISKQYDNLAVGTWYFQMTSVNSKDVESAKTNVGLKTIASASPKPTVTMSVTPTDGVSNVTPTISWGSANATSCVASGGWTGAKGLTGSAAQTKITTTTTYTLTCTGPGGVTAISSMVTVSPRPGAPIVTIK
jgi:hypothetical protein